jgi:hypothetical protein
MAITKLSSGSSFTNLIKYDSFLAGNSAFIPNSYESIATVTVGSGGSATIEFTSIPATYTHLQIRGIARDSRANTNSDFSLRFNGDSATNYSFHTLEGTGSAVSSGAATNATDISIANISGNSAGSNTFGASIADILDYANTNKYKTVRSLGGHDNNGSGNIKMESGNWRSTSAVTSITLIPNTANFVEYTQFALYGIKGA